jgi:hypothetical protein
MGGGAFNPLKTGPSWPENAKRAEIRLAILPIILRIVGSRGGKKPLAKAGNGCESRILRRFLRYMANLPKSLALLSKSQF